MSTVQTMRGPIDAGKLGVTLMHEHIFVLSTEIMQNYPEAWGDEEQRVEDAIARLNELNSRGVHSVVDLTVIGLGRYIPRIQRVAEKTAMNIIVATGIYTYNDIPFYFHFRGPGTPFDGPEVMVDMFVQGHPRRHRGHGRQGRDSEVRHRHAGPDAGRGARAAGRRRRRIGKPACPFPPTRTRAPSAAWISSAFFAKKAWIFRAW